MTLRRPAWALAAACALAACASPAQTPGRPDAKGRAGDAVASPPAASATAASPRCSDDLRAQALARLNALRERGGRCEGRVQPPAARLAWNERLERAAAWHAQDMARTGRFAHEDSRGRSADARVGAEGYAWSYVAENIAAGSEDLARVIELWQASPAHCRNLHAAPAREVGLACARGNDAAMPTRWVLVLGAPLP